MMVFVNEGKTQRVYTNEAKTKVTLRPKNVVTLGGEVIHQYKGKGRLMAECNQHCFEVLARAGVPNHLIQQSATPGASLALSLEMFKLEVVIRKVPTGSFLLRHPGCSREEFPALLVEFFHKVETGPAGADPILETDFEGSQFWAHEARKPFDVSNRVYPVRFDDVLLCDTSHHDKLVGKMTFLATQAFQALEQAWERVDCRLLDLKIEFGRDANDNLYVADELTPDNWRLVDQSGNHLSKDVARQGGSMEVLECAYARAVALTRDDRFLAA